MFNAGQDMVLRDHPAGVIQTDQGSYNGGQYTRYEPPQWDLWRSNNRGSSNLPMILEFRI